ncbi:MAG: flavodoxin family protein [Candidatus Ancillula sp.]|jgi:multimeric flavodoxin WrbA|nr:flavodoxin family protein [Candidatus Ancillula sp.]
MKKVVAYVGSRNKNSSTLKLVSSIKDAVLAISSSEIKFNIYTPNNCNIMPDDGSASAFKTGVDKIEEARIDDSLQLKKEIKDCDFLILASPTYAHAVSGDMKILIDRITYWNHIFYLANKPGQIIVTASGNGFLKVAAYIRQILENCGVVFCDDVIQTDSRILSDIDITNSALTIVNQLNLSNEVFVPSAGAEANFQHLKARYINSNKSFFEPNYWKKHGMFECENLKEYFQKVLGEKK